MFGILMLFSTTESVNIYIRVFKNLKSILFYQLFKVLRLVQIRVCQNLLK